MPEQAIGSCWSCGRELAAADYGRETNCLGCGRPTRCCRNCRWFDRSASNQCREPVADPVQEKERPNFCGWFEAASPEREAADDAEALRKAAEDLFRF